MEYRREIDGLRALAVVPVILFHAGFQAFSGGFVGVDIFFVISGYLITSIILSEKSAGTFTLVRFYERRARRILPALFFVMFACLAPAWLLLLPHEMKSFSQSFVAVSAFSSNVLFFRTSGYFETSAEMKPLLHTWSLGVEEQYYLLFPIFLIVTWRLGKRRIFQILLLTAILSLGWAQWNTLVRPAAAFFLLPARCWELLAGSFIALHFSGKDHQPLRRLLLEVLSGMGLMLICAAIFVFDKKTTFPGLNALIPTIGTALLILFATPQTLTGKLLGSKGFVGVGLVSYSAYLWHQPLLAFFRNGSIDQLDRISLAALCFASFVLAVFSWRYIEKPFRSGQVFNRTSIFVYSAAGCTLSFTIGIVGHLTDGTFWRSYGATAVYISAAASENRKNSKCWAQLSADKSLSHACHLGIDGTENSFAIVGDSHAGALANELGVAAARLKLAGYDYTYNSCPPLAGGSAKKQDSVQSVCNALRKDFLSRLNEQNLPHTLIFLARWTALIEQKRFNNKEGAIESGEETVWLAPDSNNLGYTEALQKNFSDSINNALRMGHKVVLVYPIPEMGWDVPTRLSRIYLNRGHLIPEDASTSYSVFLERNMGAYKALDAIGNHPNLFRIRPADVLCNSILPGRCAAHINGKPLYYDDDHLSNEGARLMDNIIIDQVKDWHPFPPH